MNDLDATEYCFLWIDHWATCMPRSEWAGWAQALVSTIAVVVAAIVVVWQIFVQRRLDDDDEYLEWSIAVDEIGQWIARAAMILRSNFVKSHSLNTVSDMDFDDLEACLEVLEQKIDLRPIGEIDIMFRLVKARRAYSKAVKLLQQWEGRELRSDSFVEGCQLAYFEVEKSIGELEYCASYLDARKVLYKEKKENERWRIGGTRKNTSPTGGRYSRPEDHRPPKDGKKLPRTNHASDPR